jgi:hypothetical protein
VTFALRKLGPLVTRRIVARRIVCWWLVAVTYGAVTSSALAQTAPTPTLPTPVAPAQVTPERTASAQPTERTTPAVRTEFTNVNSVVYNADNRNGRPGDVSRAVDDDWGAVFNRLHALGSYGNWRLSARVDSAWFYTSRSPTDVALGLMERGRPSPNADYSPQEADFFLNKFLEAGVERNTRYTDWTYPAKYTLTYTTPAFEATVGDFYAQFGRGLVFSVRKQDELSSDTTVRGFRLTGQKRWDNLRLQVTALGGNLNPLRVDSASGRFLGVRSGDLGVFDRVAEFGMPRVVSNAFAPDPLPTYLPDTLYGGAVELKHPVAHLSLHGVGLERGCAVDSTGACSLLSADVSRGARSAHQGGVALGFPNVADVASGYVEYAHQTLVHPDDERRGSALYASASLALSPFTLTLEGKHVRGYQTLSAGIDTGRAPEFSPVVYNLVPTTHPVWNDTQFENFGTCVTGGRLRNDLELAMGLSWFTSAGYYATYGEVGPATCEPEAKNLNRVWDLAQGLESNSQGGKSTAQFTLGTRFDDTDEPRTNALGQASTTYYREAYVRYDVVQWIGGTSSIQLQGWHRRRYQLLGGPEYAWLQGMTTTALQLGSEWNFALGVEYDQNPAFPGSYFSGQVRYNLSSSNNVSLFVGQQRGGLRCVSGVCRVFPPFEGARLESTLRF